MLFRSLQQTHDNLKDYYDGYHFSRRNMVDIYNPFSLLNACLLYTSDDENVIAGQGTIGLEILDQLPDVEAVVVPVGGGDVYKRQVY